MTRAELSGSFLAAGWLSRGDAANAPLADRVCDVATAAFGLWTLCCHALVASGGSLQQLIAVYAAALIALGAGLLWWRRRSAGAAADAPLGAAAPNAPETSDTATRRWVRVGAGVIALAAALRLDPEVPPGAVWWVTVTVLAAAAALFLLAEPPVLQTPRRGRALEWMLGGLCAVGLTAALVVHRPDIDDTFYVNVAVAAADAPDRALLSGDTLHGVADLPLHMPAHRLHTWELWNGALSLLTGIPVIHTFHWLSAGLVALLIPLAHARLFRLITPRHWLWATAAVVLVLLASGETHRSFGNFAFVRSWQGKAGYLFVFMPLVYAYAIAFGMRPSAGRWLLLCAAQVAAVGCSSTAVWAAPAGALMGLSCILRPNPRELRSFALGALSTVYVLFAGWFLKGELQPMLESALVQYEFGVQLDSALSHVFGTQRLLSFALACTIGGWACWNRGLARRFAIAFPLAVFLVLLNPYWDHWVAGNLTGPSFWRAAWSLPAPILMALVLVAPLQLRHERLPRWIGGLATTAALLAFTFCIPRFPTWSEQNAGAANVGIHIGVPGLKVPAGPYRWAKLLTDSVPTGAVVVAPSEISVWLPTFHDRTYPLQARRMYLERHEANLGTENVELRMKMTRYVAGRNEWWVTPHEVFRRGLNAFGVTGVCLQDSEYADESRAVLREEGFRRVKKGRRFEVWVRE